jgi:hypothetical protein
MNITKYTATGATPLFSRCLLEPLRAELALWDHSVYYNHAGANCSAGNTALESITGLKRSWTDANNIEFGIKRKLWRHIIWEKKKENPRTDYSVLYCPQHIEVEI